MYSRQEDKSRIALSRSLSKLSLVRSFHLAASSCLGSLVGGRGGGDGGAT